MPQPSRRKAPPKKKPAARKKASGFSRAELEKHAREHAAMKQLGIGQKPQKGAKKDAGR